MLREAEVQVEKGLDVPRYDEFLNLEIFDTLFETKVLAGHRRIEYNAFGGFCE